MAAPWTAAMTGKGRCRIAWMPPVAVSWNSRNSRTPIRVITSISSRSKPAQNARSPAPVRMSARSRLSRSARAARPYSVNIRTVWEFIRSGRLTRSTPMPASATSKVSVCSSGKSVVAVMAGVIAVRLR